MTSSSAESRDFSTPMQKQMGAQREKMERQLEEQRQQMKMLMQLTGPPPTPQPAVKTAERPSETTIDFREFSGKPEDKNASNKVVPDSALHVSM